MYYCEYCRSYKEPIWPATIERKQTWCDICDEDALCHVYNEFLPVKFDKVGPDYHFISKAPNK